LSCRDGAFVSNNERSIALHAENISVARNIFLDGKFKAKGQIRLLGAKIGHNLECHGGHFDNHNDYAINGSSMRIGNEVMFDQGFYVSGGICLNGAELGGNLVFR